MQRGVLSRNARSVKCNLGQALLKGISPLMCPQQREIYKAIWELTQGFFASEAEISANPSSKRRTVLREQQIG